jgi:hypothetical protein
MNGADDEEEPVTVYRVTGARRAVCCLEARGGGLVELLLDADIPPALMVAHPLAPVRATLHTSQPLRYQPGTPAVLDARGRLAATTTAS